jgi:hypothetical protein
MYNQNFDFFWTHSSIVWLMKEKTLKETDIILINVQVFMAKKMKYPLIYHTVQFQKCNYHI